MRSLVKVVNKMIWSHLIVSCLLILVVIPGWDAAASRSFLRDIVFRLSRSTRVLRWILWKFYLRLIVRLLIFQWRVAYLLTRDRGCLVLKLVTRLLVRAIYVVPWRDLRFRSISEDCLLRILVFGVGVCNWFASALWRTRPVLILLVFELLSWST